jgi:uncharacterized protein (TIGR02646 family)
MIRVEMASEPELFHEQVREKGNTFLSTTPNPTTVQWKKRDYWKAISLDLYSSYCGICCYTCHWIPPDTGSSSVEHFKPKSTYPNLAYEWSNFRLVCGKLNSRKKDNEDVIDPFNVIDGMFTIDFPSLLIKPASGLATATKNLVQSTISRLKLNHEGSCLKNRNEYLKQYCTGIVTFDFLLSKAPFLAKEIVRQNLRDTIISIMNYG